MDHRIRGGGPRRVPRIHREVMDRHAAQEPHRGDEQKITTEAVVPAGGLMVVGRCLFPPNVEDVMDTAESGRAWRPYEITGATAGTPDLAGWLDDLGPERLTELLVERRGLVFRGFGITADAIEAVLDRLVPD